MKRIVVVLGVTAVMAAAVALTAGTALAQAQKDTVQITNLIMQNPCTGEFIAWNGTSRLFGKKLTMRMAATTLFTLA